MLPEGDRECVSGFGVMGTPFVSGHVLGLRRWTASSVGDGSTSIWHRDPVGHRTFHETVGNSPGCTRYFGADVRRREVGPIVLEWETSDRLRVRTADEKVDWTIATGSSLATRFMSAVGVAIPTVAWRSRVVLSAMGAVAGRALDAGRIQFTGTTSNAQHFDANPQRIWFVTHSRAVVEGVDLGPPGSLTEQAHMADFSIPQRGIFAVGGVFVTNVKEAVGPSVA